MFPRVNQAHPRAAALLLIVGLGQLGGVPARAAEAPQLVLFHGHILTVDATDSTVQALAVRDGKIIAGGTNRDILKLAGPATRRIDLHGRTATP
jgi:hypothetical protein